MGRGKSAKKIRNEALDSWLKAQELLKRKDLYGARACMEDALRLLRDVDDGLERSIVFETLFYAEADFPSCGIDWYSLLHLNPSATDVEVKSRSVELIKHISSLGKYSRPVTDACDVIRKAVTVLCSTSERLAFDLKRKESGLFDFPVGSKKRTFKEEYLGWKPPFFSIDHVEAIRSNKKAELEVAFLNLQLETIKGIADHAQEVLDKSEAEVQEHEHVLELIEAEVDEHVSKIKEHETKLVGLKAEIAKRIIKIAELESDSKNALKEFASDIKSSW